MSQSQNSRKFPVLDISKTPDPSTLSFLLEACKEWGFFLITNHGISKDLVNQLCSFSRQIFSLPLDIKIKLGPSSPIKSYTPQFRASPFYESLRVSGPDFYASAECSGKVLLGPESGKFSEIMQEYGERMTDLSGRIIEVLLMSLGDGFKRKFYDSDFKSCYGYLKMINYTPPTPSQKEFEGLGKHTDMRCVTILYSDDVSCLQVRSKEGKWINMEPCENTLVVNIGDMLEAWSNGILRSSEHRVVLKKPRNRLSVAFFWTFEDKKVIFAPEEVVGEGNKRIFKSFVCSEYIRFREIGDKNTYQKVGNTVREFAGSGVEM